MRTVLHFLAVAGVLLLCGGQALGADPQPYTVTLKPTGDKAVDQAVKDSSQLVALRDKAPAGPFALVTRSRDDLGRFQGALNSFGYYKARITATIAGQTIDDANLPDVLEKAAADPPDRGGWPTRSIPGRNSTSAASTSRATRHPKRATNSAWHRARRLWRRRC